jgi:hypothetical protein
LNYDEPPGWLIPVRHSLGATLMQNGRYAEAEQIYPKPLQRTQSSRDSGPGRTPRSAVPASASQERIGLTEITVAWPGGGLPSEQIRPIEGSVRENKFEQLWSLVEELMKDLPSQNLEISPACVR